MLDMTRTLSVSTTVFALTLALGACGNEPAAEAGAAEETAPWAAVEEPETYELTADETAEELVSLHEFTQLLHDNLDEDEKAGVVRLLWRVAYADGNLDKYEDALVLKISDLLHVSRGLVMRLKHDAAT